MEIRSILEGKIYGLFMNPISGRWEDSVPVAASSDYQRLVNWYNNQRCEMYQEGWMRKQFLKGGPLECYNPIDTTELNPDTLHHHGIYSEWVRLNSGGQPCALNPDIVWLG